MGRDLEDELVPILEGYPIEFAVLFGSTVRGTASARNDIDIAERFDDDLSPRERLEARIDLTVDLIDAVGTDDIDVADFATLRPVVAQSALSNGRLLVGTPAALQRERDRIDQTDVGTHDERMSRFTTLLERLVETV